MYGTRWDLRFRFLDAPTRLACALEYDDQALTTRAAERIADRLRATLAALLAHPTAPVANLPLLPMHERAQLVADWNRTRRPAQHETVHAAIVARALATPDRAAVSSGEETLSYSQLLRAAQRLATRLSAAGVTAGARVGVLLDRGVELPVALLATAALGAAFVPLDPGHPHERIAFMVADSGAVAVLAHAHLEPLLELADAAVLTVAVDHPGDEPATAPPPAPCSADDVACIIYTSGSTGRPKGAALTQRALVNLCRTMADAPGLRDDDVYLSLTTPVFDVGTAELLAPLMAGARLEIAGSRDVGEPAALVELLGRSGATITFATPSRWRLLLAAGWRGGQRVLSAGEPLDEELAWALLERTPSVWNAYGPAETFAFSTLARVEDPTAISIGRPVDNTRLYVVDRAGALCPIGAVGELWIGGSGVAREYVNLPELSGERFVVDPFVKDGARLYKTGDLVRYRDDGQLDFLGRVDDQVKVRGFRVEPGEVSAALTALPEVVDAFVHTHRDGASIQLVAYVVGVTPAPTAAELHDALSARLPQYMVPAAFVLLPELPLSPNGKVDRRRLPAPSPTDRVDAGAYVAPAGDGELALAALFAEVLKLPRVGRHDDFFRLGGDSVRAAELIARARAELEVPVTVRALFEGPTVAQLAARIESGFEPQTTPPSIARTARQRVTAS